MRGTWQIIGRDNPPVRIESITCPVIFCIGSITSEPLPAHGIAWMRGRRSRQHSKSARPRGHQKALISAMPEPGTALTTANLDEFRGTLARHCLATRESRLGSTVSLGMRAAAEPSAYFHALNAISGCGVDTGRPQFRRGSRLSTNLTGTSSQGPSLLTHFRWQLGSWSRPLLAYNVRRALGNVSARPRCSSNSNVRACTPMAREVVGASGSLSRRFKIAASNGGAVLF